MMTRKDFLSSLSAKISELINKYGIKECKEEFVDDLVKFVKEFHISYPEIEIYNPEWKKIGLNRNEFERWINN